MPLRSVLRSPLRSALRTAIGEGVGVAAPANTAPPTITGTLTQGSLLSVTTGTWTGAPTSYAYQWTRNGTDIGGATSSTYTLVQADTARDINCRVTATNAGGSTAQLAAAMSVPAPELVSNGTFDTNTTGWSASGGPPILASVSGQLQVTNNATAFGYAWQQVTGLESGVVYTVSASGKAANAFLNLGTTQAGGQYQTDVSIANTTRTQDITTVGTNVYIVLKIGVNTNGASTLFDDISLKKKP